MDAGLDNCSSAIAPALLYYRPSMDICFVLLPAIHGSMRQHDKINAFLCALCVSTIAPALFSVSVPDSTLPIPSLESYLRASCPNLWFNLFSIYNVEGGVLPNLSGLIVVEISEKSLKSMIRWVSAASSVSSSF